MLKGQKCHKCDAIIPEFENLAEKDESRIKELIRNDRKLMAMQELRFATGCSVELAKIWVLHSGKPDAVYEGEKSLCPYCSKPLRSSLAKQCRFCKLDWHNPDNITSLE